MLSIHAPWCSHAGIYVTAIDGTTYYQYWNLGNSSYQGLLCPNFRLSDYPDEPGYLLEWLGGYVGWVEGVKWW